MVTPAVVDTDILIDVLRLYPPALAWWNAAPDPPGVCGFSAFELYEGCHNGQDVLRVTQLLRPLQMLWPSSSACSDALTGFPARFLRTRLGVMDALIAACARDLRVPLYTFNAKHFRSVDGLTIQQPYSRAQPSASP